MIKNRGVGGAGRGQVVVVSITPCVNYWVISENTFTSKSGSRWLLSARVIKISAAGTHTAESWNTDLCSVWLSLCLNPDKTVQKKNLQKKCSGVALSGRCQQWPPSATRGSYSCVRQAWGCETAAPFRTPGRSLTPVCNTVTSNQRAKSSWLLAVRTPSSLPSSHSIPWGLWSPHNTSWVQAMTVMATHTHALKLCLAKKKFGKIIF